MAKDSKVLRFSEDEFVVEFQKIDEDNDDDAVIGIYASLDGEDGSMTLTADQAFKIAHTIADAIGLEEFVLRMSKVLHASPVNVVNINKEN